MRFVGWRVGDQASPLHSVRLSVGTPSPVTGISILTALHLSIKTLPTKDQVFLIPEMACHPGRPSRLQRSFCEPAPAAHWFHRVFTRPSGGGNTRPLASSPGDGMSQEDGVA